MENRSEWEERETNLKVAADSMHAAFEELQRASTSGRLFPNGIDHVEFELRIANQFDLNIKAWGPSSHTEMRKNITRVTSTKSWSFGKLQANFKRTGCSVANCWYNDEDQTKCGSTFNCCALNVSDAVYQAGYDIESLTGVKRCDSPPHDNPRVLAASGMRAICNDINGAPDATSWDTRPNKPAIVFFGPPLGRVIRREDCPNCCHHEERASMEFAVTGHVDIWDGTQALHEQYPGAAIVEFWLLGS